MDFNVWNWALGHLFITQIYKISVYPIKAYVRIVVNNLELNGCVQSVFGMHCFIVLI